MSQSNILQGYTWDAQYDDPQQQFSRPIQDEVISVYEVYVKEETVGVDGRSDISIVSGEPAGSSGQLMQTNCLDLDAAIGSEVINADGTITKLLEKDTVKYKILDQNINEENLVVYSQPVSEGPSATTRLIDKDDPRSRLHFVKYLKRDGKTLKIWECGICSKEFRHQYTLMRHLPTHTDERNFKCEACGKAFRQLSTLSQHRAIHSDARPYVCEFCKKTFNRVSTLISHRKTHSEHKPHKCHMCGKGFHQKGNLRNHVFTHTNERPYKCEICSKGFNQMSNLMCHKVKAHAHAEKMQYVCGICGKEFPRRFSLRSHEEYKHGIKYRHPNNAPAAVLQDNNDPGVMRNKNVSIVSLPNGERPMICNLAGDKENLNPGGYAGSVMVDKIETKAMENAILEGQTPFALFKPAKGIPVLVKVTSCSTSNRKQVLTPATAEDLRMAGKMSLSPTLADVDGVKAVQIKVPVVATVTQRIEADGSCSFLIEPPGPGQEQESLIEPIASQFSLPEHRAPDLRSGIEKSSSQDQVNSGSAEDCNDLLELAAQGGIQFVRATEDGRYEVMTNSEARDLMAQNSHDVTILDGEEAEAISVVNLRNQQQQHNNIENEQISSHVENENRQEIIIGDSNNEITVLNSGTSCQLIEKNNLTMNGIEILGEKDIRTLQGSKNLDNVEEDDRFTQSVINIFDHEKIDDFSLLGRDLELQILNHETITPISNRHYQSNGFTGHSNNSLSNVKNFHQHPPINSKNQNSGISILNHNFHHNYKQNNFFGDGLSPTILSSSNDYNTMMKNHLNGDFISTKLINKIPDFEKGENLLNIGINKPEVKILGAKNGQIINNKVKILGHAMDKTEIDKVLKLGNSSSPAFTKSEPVKILGSKNHKQLLQGTSSGEGGGGGGDYKDTRVIGINNSPKTDQFPNSIINNEKKIEQFKILGKKKDPQINNSNNPIKNEKNNGDFEVRTSIFESGRSRRRMAETIVIEDSEESDNSQRSGDYNIQTSCKTVGDENEIYIPDDIRMMCNIYDQHNQRRQILNSYNDETGDEEYVDDNIKLSSISEKDFEIIGHNFSYNKLPDLD